MAPRGQKRTAAAGAEEPSAKRVAALLKQHGISKSMHEGVREIVLHPLAGLPQHCVDMLLGMLPYSLCVPTNQRTEDQHDVVEMVREVAEAIQAEMRKEVEEANAAVSTEDARKAELQHAVQEAEAALEEAVAAVDERKTELAETSSALLTKKHALGDAEATEKKDSMALETTRARQLELEGIRINNFQKCKDGDFQPGEEDALFKPIKALIRSLKLDESLATSLPVSLCKKDRGAFDQVVVDQFEQVLVGKIAEQAATVESMGGSAATNAAAVEAAKQAFGEAQEAQQDVARRFGAAQGESAKAKGKLDEAKKAAAAFEPEYIKATAARQEKVDQLENFKVYNCAMLNELVNKVAVQKEEAEVAKTEQDDANAMNTEPAEVSTTIEEEADVWNAIEMAVVGSPDKASEIGTPTANKIGTPVANKIEATPEAAVAVFQAVAASGA